MNDLHAAARRCLDATDPGEKVRLSFETWSALCAGTLIADPASPAPFPIGLPGRPERPRLVPARELAQRGLGTAEGRAALVHAIAHIEFNAIDLAWDAVYRFREARHFTMLSGRLAELGHAYGDFDAHNGLWEMAEKTAHSDTARMALVPRVLEARGLDVTPGMMERLHRQNDERTVAILDVILREEVAHVAAGTRWFHWCCERDGIEPEATFAQLLTDYMNGSLRGPFNLDARREAGFSESELVWLQTLG
jgi:uncharacterized ferritin-like protein (DUF455 family)